MKFQELSIKGAWVVESEIHNDERGSFQEWWKASDFNRGIGLQFTVAQANMSISSKGALRGIHYSLEPKGQAKWITCTQGKIWDVIVDIRPNSETYKQWIGIQLSAELGKSVFLSGNLGHAFISLEEETVVNYMLSSEYNPSLEHEINPFDSEIGIDWPNMHKILSKKDLLGKKLKDRELDGTLPHGY